MKTKVRASGRGGELLEERLAATPISNQVTAYQKLLIAGPLIIVAGGRWGSQLTIPGTQVYIPDGLIVLGLLGWLFSKTASSKLHLPPRALLLTSGALIVALALGSFAAETFALRDFMRDAAPFAFLASAPLMLSAFNGLAPDKLIDLLGKALIVHLGWFLPAALGFLPSFTLPGLGGVAIFTTRGDVDGLLAGMLCLWLLVFRARSAGLSVLLISLALLASLANGSRAGFVAAVLLTIVGVLLSKPWRHGKNGWLIPFGACLGSASLLVFVWAAPTLPAWAKGLERILPGDSSLRVSAENTKEARYIAWRLIVEWLQNAPGKFLFGDGFGSSYVAESGALPHLSGDPSVRNAHNFAVSWLAQVGVVGMVFAIVGLIGIIFFCYRTNAPEGSFAVWTAIALLFVSSIGVVLESPFGYELLFIGMILCHSKRGTRSFTTGADAQSKGVECRSGKRLSLPANRSNRNRSTLQPVEQVRCPVL